MFEYNNKSYEIIIVKKKIKNLYIRVKEDLKIYITCNNFTTNKMINNIIYKNRKSIISMIDNQERRKDKNKDFCYLGKKYNKILINSNNIEIIDNRIFYSSDVDLEKWIINEAKIIFQKRINICINNFNEKLPKINLKIRNMKTRWGVCNRKNNNVTLNLDLIKYDIEVIDYVIYHELCHFVHPNHSSDFWKLVEFYVKDYKNIKNILKK